MKTQIKFASLFLIVATVLIVGQATATAGITKVYNNGLPDGNDAWAINYGFTVADSFTLSSTANVNHIDFWVAMFPGDSLTSVNWTIFTLGPKSGKIWGTGTAIATYEAGNCSGAGCEQGISFPAISLPAGTYWLKLGKAQATNGDPVYWWESGGPSSAYENSVGTIPSEAFDVVDPPITSSAPQSSAPEPDRLALLGVGGSGLAGMLLRKLMSF
jgi:hypothetical protein